MNRYRDICPGRALGMDISIPVTRYVDPRTYIHILTMSTTISARSTGSQGLHPQGHLLAVIEISTEPYRRELGRRSIF